MKRLAALAVIMMFVVSSTGCRRGLRLWGLRGAPCQPAPTAPAFGGGGGLLGGLGAGAGQGGPMMGAPMPTTTCCPPVECPPIDCGCATGASIDPGYASVGGSGMNIVSDPGFQINPGETLADIGPSSIGPSPQVIGTATAPPSPLVNPPPAAMAPGLAPLP